MLYVEKKTLSTYVRSPTVGVCGLSSRVSANGYDHASWQWPCPTPCPQLWDRDVFKWNDHIAEGLLDLGKYFRKAYKTREVVKLFQEIDPKEIQRKREEERAEVCYMFKYSQHSALWLCLLLELCTYLQVWKIVNKRKFFVPSYIVLVIKCVIAVEQKINPIDVCDSGVVFVISSVY